MTPEAAAERVLVYARAKAKMYEYAVPDGDHIDIPISPAVLFSLALGLVGDAAASIAAGRPDAPLRETSQQSIRFAATFFDTFIDTKLDARVADEFALLAAASYYLSDMPGNARLLANRIEAPRADGANGLDWLVFRLLRSELEPSRLYRVRYPNLCPILEALQAFFLARGDEEDVLGPVSTLRSDAYNGGDGRSVLYADLAVALCRWKIQSSSRRQLPDASGLSLETWEPSLRKPGFVSELWPAQRRLCDAGLLSGRSAVVQMPTSAGKTRATELIIRSAFLADRSQLAVIVCPFRALCHDVRSDLAKAFQGENVAINEATDAFQLDLTIEDLWARKSVLIVTPEKFLYILRRSPELADQVGLIIYDEGHQFDSPSRGVGYELLLTSLKLLLPEETQTVLLSAVIANAPNVAGWLIGDEEAVVTGEGLAPTSRSVAFASWATRLGQLRYVNPLDPEDLDFFVPRVIEAVNLGRRGRERSDRIFPTVDSGSSVGLYLGLKVVRNGSVALFCGQKNTAANICDLAVDVFSRGYDQPTPRSLSDNAEVGKLMALSEQHVGADASETRAASLGVFSHHTNVPNGLRLSIEHAMKEGLITFIVCTSTLAQGVNLPIKYLVVTGVYQGTDRIMVRDFHNLIGRAGRAGMHTEGSVIFAQNNVFDGRLDRNSRWRWDAAKDLLNPKNSEPSASSILWLFEPFTYGRPVRGVVLDVPSMFDLAFNDDEEIARLVAELPQAHPEADLANFERDLRVRAHIVQAIASFVLAHLDFDGETLVDDAATLCSSTLAYYLADEDQRADLQQLFRNIATYVLEQAPTPDLRQSIRRSALSPRSVRSLTAWLTDNLDALNRAVIDGTLLDAIAAQILKNNSNSTLVSFAPIDAVISMAKMWMDGSSFSEIHNEMLRQGVRIGGNARVPKVEDIVGVCEGGLGYDGAMLVSTLADLAESLDEGLSSALSGIHKRMKYGVPTQAAVVFYEIGFADRVVSSALAATFPGVVDRASAIVMLRVFSEPNVREILEPFPSYFSAVSSELIGG